MTDIAEIAYDTLGAAVPLELDALLGVPVCRLEELDEERGVAALVGDRQVALFRLSGRPGEHRRPEVRAIANRDPFSGANVLARGIVGSAGEQIYVASPMHKQRFDLYTGRCLDDDTVAVEVWPVALDAGWVHVCPTPLTLGPA